MVDSTEIQKSTHYLLCITKYTLTCYLSNSERKIHSGQFLTFFDVNKGQKSSILLKKGDTMVDSTEIQKSTHYLLCITKYTLTCYLSNSERKIHSGQFLTFFDVNKGQKSSILLKKGDTMVDSTEIQKSTHYLLCITKYTLTCYLSNSERKIHCGQFLTFLTTSLKVRNHRYFYRKRNFKISRK